MGMRKLKQCQPMPASGFMTAKVAANCLNPKKVIVASIVHMAVLPALLYKKAVLVVIEPILRSARPITPR